MDLRRVTNLALRLGVLGVATVATGSVGVAAFGNPSCGGYGDPDLLAAGVASTCSWGPALWQFLLGVGVLLALAGLAAAGAASLYRRVATPP